MKEGDVLEHEFMGEVVETGSAVRSLSRSSIASVQTANGSGRNGATVIAAYSSGRLMD